MLELRVRVPRVVESEDRPSCGIPLTGEIPDLRIVPVDDERGIAPKLADGGPPALGNELELAVAVELVAKKVAETHGAGPQPTGNFRQRRFVDLEQPQLHVASGEERRGNAGDEIRAGAVVREPDPAAENTSGHRRRGRLAVRRRH